MRETFSLTRRAAAALPLATLLGAAAATVPALAAAPDPVLAQIELHRALRRMVNTLADREDDPVFAKACKEHEAAIQALGDLIPTTVAGAAAQLAYMAEIEADFADEQSPLLRCVLSAARGLQQMARSA